MNKVEKIVKKIIGYILITPALLSVFVIATGFFNKFSFIYDNDSYQFHLFYHKSYQPFFICFLALIGVYLLKDDNRK
jgi:hypothetical protein